MIDAEHQSKYGNTALHLAVSSRSEELMQLLLEKGVNSDMLNCHFSSPLFSTACSGHLSILQLLYKAGLQEQTLMLQPGMEEIHRL